MKKIVFVPMCADLIHHGHINIIIKARKLGKVIVGLMTDNAMASYKRVTLLRYKQRKKIVENIIGVEKIVPMKTWDYVPSLKRIKPDYIIHGDDWKKPDSSQHRTRKRVIRVIKEWGGKLIEPKYTRGISSSYLIKIFSKTATDL